MKTKNISLVLGLLCLSSSSVVLAGDGTAVKCKGYPINLVVINKNLPDMCNAGRGGKYCITSPDIKPNNPKDWVCEDSNGIILFKGWSYSAGFNEPRQASLTWKVYSGTRRSFQEHPLKVVYKSGQLSANCGQVFGNDAVCTFTSPNPKTHVLTISKR